MHSRAARRQHSRRVPLHVLLQVRSLLHGQVGPREGVGEPEDRRLAARHVDRHDADAARLLHGVNLVAEEDDAALANHNLASNLGGIQGVVGANGRLQESGWGGRGRGGECIRMGSQVIEKGCHVDTMRE